MSTSWILAEGERYVHHLPKMLIQIGIGRIWRPGQNLRLFFIISQGYSPVNGDGGHAGVGIVLTW